MAKAGFALQEEVNLMAEYWGLEAICDRMGWKDRRAPVRQMVKSGFLMYQRRRGKHPRRV